MYLRETIQKEKMMLVTHKAKLLATVAHGACGHIRRYSGIDYIVHPIQVADTLVAFGFGDDLNLIAAAYCHDVVEDTSLDCEYLETELNIDVANIVYDVTNPSKDFPELNRKDRKALDLEHLKHAGVRAMALKLADILCNAPDIITDDPKFAKTWVPEAKRVIEVCRNGSDILYSEAKYALGKFDLV